MVIMLSDRAKNDHELPPSLAKQPLRIGTRGSPLALAQTAQVIDALTKAWPQLPRPQAVTINTTGDRITDRPLADIGGKGLFAAELETALRDGTIDCAVHSMKDMETFLPDGLTIAAVLKRADPRDCLVLSGAQDAPPPEPNALTVLPTGAKVATASIRREAQLRAQRPDLQFVSIRGNVKTRLDKLDAGLADATFLAQAGLDRLSVSRPNALPLSIDDMLPACCQGIIGIECRDDNQPIHMLLGAINHPDSWIAMQAERAVLAALDGSCRSPIAAHAVKVDTAGPGRWHLRAMVAAPDGSAMFRTMQDGSAEEIVSLATQAGHTLRQQVPRHLLDAPSATPAGRDDK